MPKIIPAAEALAELNFPHRGIDVSIGYQEQRPGTTPTGNNVRLFEPASDRGRGSARQGLVRYLDDAMPAVIQDLNFVILVSAAPLGISFSDVPILDLNFQILDFADPAYLLADGSTNWIFVGGSGYYTHPSYTRNARPTITSVSPDTEGDFAGGETITITGENMGDTDDTFKFGSQTAMVLSNDGSTATVTAPAQTYANDVLTVDVTVTTDTGTSETNENTEYEYQRIKHVQSKTTQEADVSTNHQFAFDADVTEGSLILVIVQGYDDVNFPPSYANVAITDSQSNSYTQVNGYARPFSTNNDSISLWWAIAGSSGALTITITPDTHADIIAVAMEYEGTDQSTPISDSSNNGATSGTALSTGTVATGTNDSMHLAVFNVGAGVTLTPESGFTLRTSYEPAEFPTERFFIYERRNQTAGDNFTATASDTIGWIAFGINVVPEPPA